jgi:glycosyltransferase involved in cell wall biosynthesis
MKIILFVNSMGSGGAERVASTLVNSWAARGDTVTLVATYTGRGNCAYPIASEVRFLYLADLIRQGGRGPLAYVARFVALRRIIRECEADVIVSFLTNVNIVAILASLGLGIPVIACEHNNPTADGRSRFWHLLCRLVYPRANAVTLLTQSAVAPFAAVVPGVQRFAVVPNPLPDDLLLLARRSVQPSARKRLLSVGRLCSQKQFDLLIGVFAALSAQFANWDLWIWGEGPDRAALEAAIRAHGLEGRIFLPGTTSTLWSEMVEAQAFVLSSRYEGLPMALMEGMALGLPAVAFDCPSGPRELLCDGQNGMLVPAGDAAAMTQALRSLLSDDALRAELGLRAALSVRERYSLRAVLAVWDDLFAQVGAGSARTGS